MGTNASVTMDTAASLYRKNPSQRHISVLDTYLSFVNMSKRVHLASYRKLCLLKLSIGQRTGCPRRHLFTCTNDLEGQMWLFFCVKCKGLPLMLTADQLIQDIQCDSKYFHWKHPERIFRYVDNMWWNGSLPVNKYVSYVDIIAPTSKKTSFIDLKLDLKLG